MKDPEPKLKLEAAQRLASTDPTVILEFPELLREAKVQHQITGKPGTKIVRMPQRGKLIY